MLGTELTNLSTGRHILAWVLSQTDIWYLLYRCAHYVGKNQEQTSNVSVLDNLFTLDDEYVELAECNQQLDRIRKYILSSNYIFSNNFCWALMYKFRTFKIIYRH